jgi:hypothetical protein
MKTAYILGYNKAISAIFPLKRKKSIWIYCTAYTICKEIEEEEMIEVMAGSKPFKPSQPFKPFQPLVNQSYFELMVCMLGSDELFSLFLNTTPS